MFVPGMVLARMAKPKLRCQPNIPEVCDYLFVGEAPGEREAELGRPFVGSSGKELRRMIEDAGLPLHRCGFTNVFMDQPENNKILTYTTSKTEASLLAKALGFTYTFPAIAPSAYVKPHLLWEVLRLRQEVYYAKPKVIIPLGNTPLWALAGVTGIGKYRGTVMPSTLCPDFKLVPTYHPAFVLRVWDNRTTVLADLIKAKREAKIEGIVYPKREIWIPQTIDDLQHFEPNVTAAPVLSVDIELNGPFISCVGLAPRRDLALVLPFMHLDGSNYWPTVEAETSAWVWLDRILSTHPCLLMHNGLFDTQHLLASKIVPRNFKRDTMFKHHSMFPELPKSLAFLVSIYCNERAWKTIRPRIKHELEKDSDE